MNGGVPDPELERARRTIKYADRVLQVIRGVGTANAELSMAPRQAGELITFIEAHLDELREAVDQQWPQVLVRQEELNRALVFVEQAFLAPRIRNRNQQVIEAADWMCVDGFRQFVQDLEGPIGPLVAIDPRRSPAVWAPDQALPMPSLFQLKPDLVPRGQEPGRLASFPLICLPSNMVDSPEYLPLLSHEVGHAVDNVTGITASLKERLAGSDLDAYWKAWMREIVADAVGLLLSGEAFAIALDSYVQLMGVSDSINAAHAYPGISLRLLMLADSIELLGLSTGVYPPLARQNNYAQNLGARAQSLRDDFRNRIFDLLYGHLRRADWLREQQLIQSAVSTLPQGARETCELVCRSISDGFRLLPSVVTVAQFHQADLNTLQTFESLHAAVPADARPKWVGEPTTWKFSRTDLPSLRPTLLAPDQQTKVPPLVLLMTHDRISFVGATHGQLVEILRKAIAARNQKPWSSIELFFASDALLASVVRNGDSNLKEERDRAIVDLKKFLAAGGALEWTLYQFDGPAVYASYWDCDRPGGRIHISPQLLGTDLRECPSMDYLWYDEIPTPTYMKYRKHLDELRRLSHRLSPAAPM